MPFCTWDAGFDLEIGIMNEHHQRLVSLINAAYDAIQLNDTHGMAHIVGELLDYTAYHFSTEADLMHQCNYPSQVSHQEQHDYFSRHVGDLQNRLHAREALHNLQIVIFLKGWLMKHILVTDKELAVYLAGNGPSTPAPSPLSSNVHA